MVQRRAARFVTGNYTRESSVTDMITTVGWMSLEDRRRNLRIANLHKIIHGELHLDLDIYASKKITRLRRSHEERYDVTSEFISTSQLKNSFFPDTISHWNNLPSETVASKSTEVLKTKLKMHQKTQRQTE